MWIIDSVKGHNIIISKYIPLGGTSYIKLPNKLDHPRNRLINIQNFDDNETLKLSIVRYLNISAHNPKRITKVDKYFDNKLDFKDVKLPVKIKGIHKTENKENI